MKPTSITKAIEIISALFILVFVYTATTKLLSHHSFLVVLKKSPLIGFAGDFLSWTLPPAELVISAMLFFPRTKKTGLIASLALMSVFTIYIAYMLITSSQLPCSCGGVIANLSWKQHLWLNVFLLVLAATGLALIKRLKFLLQ